MSIPERKKKDLMSYLKRIIENFGFMQCKKQWKIQPSSCIDSAFVSV